MRENWKRLSKKKVENNFLSKIDLGPTVTRSKFNQIRQKNFKNVSQKNYTTIIICFLMTFGSVGTKLKKNIVQ